MSQQRPSRLVRRAKSGLIAGVSTALVAVSVAVGCTHTPPAVDPRLLPGTIWLTSQAIGRMTLLNGVSTEVAADATVTAPGSGFTTVQAARQGFAVSANADWIIGVDNATLHKRPGKPFPDEPHGLSAFPTEDTVFVADRARHLVQAMNPATLEKVGGAFPIPDGNPSLVADGRRLWAMDPATGELSWFSTESAIPTTHTRAHVLQGDQGSLAIAKGQPVLVDVAAQSAALLSVTTGATQATMRIPVRGTDLVTGSPNTTEIFVVEPDRGMLRVCSFATNACTPDARISAPNDDLGSPVAAGNHVFVPDYTDHSVSLVSLADNTVRHTISIFDRPIRFELLTQDGLVFFNDPNSEKAGTITPTGDVRRVNKYNPKAPSSPPTSAPTTAVAIATPSATHSVVGTPISGNASGPSPTSSKPGGGGGGPTDGGPPHIVRLRITPIEPEVGMPVHFAAELTGAPPETWTWRITRKPDGAVEDAPQEPEFNHVFTASANYRISLAVARGPDHDEQSTSVVVYPASPVLHCGDVVMTRAVLRNDLHCTGNGLIIGAPDVVVDLGGYTISGSGGDTGIVLTNHPHPTIRNGTITGFRSGLTAFHDPDVHLQDVHFIDNAVGVDMSATANTRGGPGFTMSGGEIRGSGLALRAEPGDRLSLSTVTISGGRVSLNQGRNAHIAGCTFINSMVGVHNSSNGATMEGNTFNDSVVSVTEGDDVTIRNNRIAGQMKSAKFALQVYANSRRAAIRDNDFTGADLAFWVEDGVAAEVDHNTFTHNRIGIQFIIQVSSSIAFTRNTFTDNDAAGMLVLPSRGVGNGLNAITGNTFIHNGFRSGGLRDNDGQAVNDGLHISARPDRPILVRGNTTVNNSDYGIEAVSGSVEDGGGNRSQGDPNGCLGVTCT